MHFVYIDDSGDEKVYGFSALAIPLTEFRPTLLAMKSFRRRLRETDGIFINRQFHAVDFLAGRGRVANKTVSKWRRSEIFRLTLELTATIPGLRLFNAFGLRREKRLTKVIAPESCANLARALRGRRGAEEKRKGNRA